MAGELNAFVADQDVDAGAVERSAESVGMQRLAPLAIGFFVTVAAVFGVRESAGAQETAALEGRIAGQGNVVLAKAVVIGLRDLIGIFFLRNRGRAVLRRR